MSCWPRQWTPCTRCTAGQQASTNQPWTGRRRCETCLVPAAAQCGVFAAGMLHAYDVAYALPPAGKISSYTSACPDPTAVFWPPMFCV